MLDYIAEHFWQLLTAAIIGAAAVAAAAIYVGSQVERDVEHTRLRAAARVAKLEDENRRLLARVRPQPQVELAAPEREGVA